MSKRVDFNVKGTMVLRDLDEHGWIYYRGSTSQAAAQVAEES